MTTSYIGFDTWSSKSNDKNYRETKNKVFMIFVRYEM